MCRNSPITQLVIGRVGALRTPGQHGPCHAESAEQMFTAPGAGLGTLTWAEMRKKPQAAVREQERGNCDDPHHHRGGSTGWGRAVRRCFD